MNARQYIAVSIFPLFLMACSPQQQEASRLGFSGVDEMHDIQAQGWHTKAQFIVDQNAAARKVGFADYDEMQAAKKAGYADKASWDKHLTVQAAAEKQASGNPTAAPTSALDAARPIDEVAFLAAVSSARDTYNNAPNDMAKGAAKAQRKAGVCAALGNSFTVNNWVGTIKVLGANGDGKGYLTVEIGDNVTVKTWNNIVSDSGSDTLMDPASDAFKAASALAVHDKIRFSGSLFPNDVDCVEETSFGLGGSMSSPEYLMRFSYVAKL